MHTFRAKENIRHAIPKNSKNNTPETSPQKELPLDSFKPNTPNMFRHKESSTGAAEGQSKKNNTGLPDHLKTGIENLSGISMDAVRVHYNSYKPAKLQALAYTKGTDIYVASGQEKHLPHEAWHVVQQQQGRVRPTTQINGVHINDNASLEHEADVMGNKAAHNSIN